MSHYNSEIFLYIARKNPEILILWDRVFVRLCTLLLFIGINRVSYCLVEMSCAGMRCLPSLATKRETVPVWRRRSRGRPEEEIWWSNSFPPIFESKSGDSVTEGHWPIGWWRQQLLSARATPSFHLRQLWPGRQNIYTKVICGVTWRNKWSEINICQSQWWSRDQSCPRVGWTRGSGRVGSGRVGSGRVGSRFCRSLAGRVGSGQHFGFISFLLIISWYLNQYESSNTTFGLIDFHRYLIYNNYLVNK